MPRNLVLITYDSCRYDSAAAAKAPNLARLGTLEQRWSYASWTAPSHYTYMMGLIPHRSPTHVYASDVYKEDFSKWSERLERYLVAVRDGKKGDLDRYRQEVNLAEDVWWAAYQNHPVQCLSRCLNVFFPNSRWSLTEGIHTGPRSRL